MRMWQTIRIGCLERHVDAHPYAALVISGRYEEAGDGGCFAVQAGNALFHDPFEAHRNRFFDEGAMVLNLRLTSQMYCGSGMARVDDPDSIARLAETDGRAA